MFFRNAPLGRIDSNLIAALAGVTAVDRTVRLVTQVADPGSLAIAARRFVEVEVLRFAFDGSEVFVTVTDAIALVTAGIVLVRFGVWLMAPIAATIRRRLRR